ncbi:phosphotransferase enzyme family protein [Actinotalea sp. Marseille-Q4924]|uniref:phosphotransferase enzyme family protein n=1 Tax=Actinotalea sp. Marseille-Q4924 TaxID=2866571 RepID=UPI001CE3FEA6|nr:phosphotransferase [Actinotalea sp. Marseille-Q4924]
MTGGLHAAARAALDAYGRANAPFVEISTSHNTVCRVDAPGGPFALRIAPHGTVHRPGAADAERALLDDLASRGVRAPRVVPTDDGAASVTVEVPDLPGARECMLLAWVPGVPVRRPCSVEQATDLGRVAAQLHELAPTALLLPPGVLDGRDALAFAVPDLLDTAGRLAPVLRDAHDRAQAAVDDLWESRAGAGAAARVLHGDLTQTNVLTTEPSPDTAADTSPGDAPRLVPIDFQDLLWGHVEQDLAISLLRLSRDDETGERCAAFRAGYAAVRPWPALDAGLLRDLFAARRLQMVNLTLVLGRPGSGPAIDLHTAALERYAAGAGPAGQEGAAIAAVTS